MTRTNAPLFVLDTHALLWFLLRDRRLSAPAHKMIFSVREGAAEIIIPTILLAEALYLSGKGRLAVAFDDFIGLVNSPPAFTVLSFGLDIFEAMRAIFGTYGNARPDDRGDRGRV